jgi:hypothetical protein
MHGSNPIDANMNVCECVCEKEYQKKAEYCKNRTEKWQSTKSHFANYQFYLDEVLKNHSNLFYGFEYESSKQEYLKSKNSKIVFRTSRSMHN